MKLGVMKIKKTEADGKVIYKISGRIDTQSAPDLQDHIDALFEKMKKEGNNKIELVLDFKGVEYTSSAGLRTILYTKKKIDSMAEGSKFEIINISPEIMEVFDMTGFSDFLSLNGSEN